MAKQPTKVVYVAGPFRANTSWKVQDNVLRAENLSLEVWKLGGIAVCPHKNTEHFSGEIPDETVLAGLLELVTRCDAVVLVEGWEDSSGTLDEIVFAMHHNIPVFTSINRLAIWLYHETISEVQSEIKVKALQLREARRAKAGA